MTQDGAQYKREILQFLYEENAKVSSTFWEWRHKVMTFFVAATAALVAVAGWVVDHDLGKFVAAPLLLAGLFSLVAAFLNIRTGRIVGASYEKGAWLEDRLLALENASTPGEQSSHLIFGWLKESRDKRADSATKVTYQNVLTGTFFLLAAAFFVLAAFVLAGDVLNEPPK